MNELFFIGDEVTACGFRLAGIPVAVADSDIDAVFNEACTHAWLIILTAAAATRLASDRLEAIIARGHPLLLLLPDAVGGMVPEDIGQQLHALIGPSHE